MSIQITVIGGGSGQANLLRGLKLKDVDLSAVVTMADDGGGSGKLRAETGMLPPGDIRNCIIALSNIEPAMETVMQHRFQEGSLKGQSFGNLFLAALHEIYGDFEVAVSKVSEILAVKGRVLPVTLDDVTLSALLDNGNIIEGESIIPYEAQKQKAKIKEIKISPKSAQPFGDVINRLQTSQGIVLSSGSLYTSLLPNLVISEVSRTIYESSAIKIYVANLMTEWGETTGYDIIEHVEAINHHAGYPIIDYLIVNNGKIPEDMKEKYKKNGQIPLCLNTSQRKQLEAMDIKVVEAEVVSEKKGLLVHNSQTLAEIIMDIVTNNIETKIFNI